MRGMRRWKPGFASVYICLQPTVLVGLSRAKALVMNVLEQGL
jgi:hypothetical protein